MWSNWFFSSQWLIVCIPSLLLPTRLLHPYPALEYNMKENMGTQHITAESLLNLWLPSPHTHLFPVFFWYYGRMKTESDLLTWNRYLLPRDFLENNARHLYDWLPCQLSPQRPSLVFVGVCLVSFICSVLLFAWYLVVNDHFRKWCGSDLVRVISGCFLMWSLFP